MLTSAPFERRGKLNGKARFLGVAGAAAAFPRLALAQQAPKVPRVVVLSNGITDVQKQAIFQGLQDFGYADGKNVAVEFLTAPTIADVPDYAAQTIARKPDLIWTLSSAPPLAIKELTATIPVVFTNLQDPVAIGLVPNYGHPGGNLTGDMLAGIDFAAKQIDLIRQVLPKVTQLAFVGLPADPPYPVLLSQVSMAAKSLDFSTSLFETKEGDDLAALFDRVATSGAQVVYVIPAAYLTTVNVTLLAGLSLQRKLPAFASSLAARSGFLVGYGANNADVVRRSASFVNAILKGAKPGDLPVDQPTVFELVVNQKTAKALGITIPQSVLFQATEVIE